MRWDQADVPHKGWTEIRVEDIGECLGEGESIDYEQCEMCGKEKIRYIHIVTHPEMPNELRVGCICASKMTDDYVNPEARERDLKNRINRKHSFMKREWRQHAGTGNYILRYKGWNITIMKSKYGPGWGVIFAGRMQWKYQGKKIMDFYTARIVAFNMFDEMYNVEGNIRANWDDEYG